MSRTIWKKCIGKRVCVKVWFKKVCFNFRFCVAIIKDGRSFFFVITGFGKSWKHKLFSGCRTVFSFRIAKLKLCASVGRSSVKFVVRGCLGALGLKKCWTLYSRQVRWASLASLDSGVMQLMIPDAQELAFVSQLTSEDEDNLVVADAALDPDDFVAFAAEHETLMAAANLDEDDDEGAIDIEPELLMMNNFEAE